MSLPGCRFAESDVRDVLSPGPDLLYYGGGEAEEGAELQLDGNPESTVSPWDAAGAQHWYLPLSSTCLNYKNKPRPLHLFVFLLTPPTSSMVTHRPASNHPAPEAMAATVLFGSQDSSHRGEDGGEAAAAWTPGPPGQSEGEKASCRSASPWELRPPGSD